MSHGNRGRFFAAVTAIVAILLSALIVKWVYETGATTAVGRYRAEHRSGDYAADAQERIERDCLQRESVTMTRCIREVVETTNEHYRSEYDLIAQREMAIWAFWMVIVSVGSVVTTGIGIIYVARTLREARETTKAAVRGAIAAEETVKEAREATKAAIDGTEAAFEANAIASRNAERQLRAYVLVESSQVLIDENGLGGVLLTFKNSSQTPAIDLVIACHMKVELVGSLTELEPVQFNPTASKFSVSASGGRDKKVGPVQPSIVGALQSGQSQMIIWGEARYSDIFGRPHWSRFHLVCGGPYGFVHGQTAIVAGSGNDEDKDEE